MPDLFFYRDPEEVEREEAAKEAEVIKNLQIKPIWKSLHSDKKTAN